MKTAVVAVTIFFGAFGAAQAQSDMSCADLLKANAQLDAAAKAEVAKDPTGAALDKKINDCGFAESQRTARRRGQGRSGQGSDRRRAGQKDQRLLHEEPDRQGVGGDGEGDGRLSRRGKTIEATQRPSLRASEAIQG